MEHCGASEELGQDIRRNIEGGGRWDQFFSRKALGLVVSWLSPREMLCPLGQGVYKSPERLLCRERNHMESKHRNGQHKGQVMLYALSTCIWCKKTKELLENLDVDFDYIDVDQLNSQDKTQAIDEIKKWNPSCSFPSLVIDNNQCIVGFKEKEIRNRLGL